jgi:hypothetical protein
MSLQLLTEDAAFADEAIPHMMCELDLTGDKKTTWDPLKEPEVDAARAEFDRLKKAGYTAYTANKKGEPKDIMATFDPNAERMILMPRMVGG